MRFTASLRLALSLILALLVTWLEVQLVRELRDSLAIAVSIAAYALLIPSLVAVITLWEEVTVSISRLITRPIRRREIFVALNAISRSRQLYVLGKALFKGFFSVYVNELARRIELAATVLDPINISALVFIASLCSGVTSFVFSYMLTLNLLLSIVIAIVVIALTISSPIVFLELLISSRRSGLEIELPFFTLYSTLIEKAGRSLSIAFERIIEQEHVFKKMSREAMIVEKIATFFKPSPIEALAEYASTNPSKKLRDLINGYVSIVKIGGDTAAYLESCSQSLLKEMSARWSEYTEKVGFLGDILVALFMLMPSIIVLGAIAFNEPLSIKILEGFTYVLTPIIGAALYVMIDMIQPKLPSSPLFSLIDRVIAVSGIPMAIAIVWAISTTLDIDIIAMASIGGAIALLPLLAVYIARSIEVSRIDRDLPKFLRDIAEFLKIGYTIPKAVVYISRNRRYNRFLDGYVRGLAFLFEMNIPLSRIQRNFVSRSWLFNYSLLMLSELESLGAITPAEVESLANFIEAVVSSKMRARASLTLYAFLTLLTPVFILMLAMLAYSMISMMSVGGIGGIGAMQILSIELVRSVIEKIKMLALVISIVSGVLAAKVRDGTGLNPLYTIASLSILAIVLLNWSTLIELMPLK